MRPKFQADADLHFEIVLGVVRREPSVDFQSAQEVFADGANDHSVLHRAAGEDRILISHDVSTMPGTFRAFLALNRSPGLFLVPQNVPIGRAIADIVLIWSASDAHEWRDRITWLPL